MSIKFKILLPMILFTVLAAAGILVAVIVQFSSYVDDTMSTAIRASSEVAESYMNERKNASVLGAYMMAGDDAIRDELKAGNRDALLGRASELLTLSGIEYAIFTDSNGVVVLRTHEPDKYGDDISSRFTIKTALSGKSAAGYEKGTAIPLAIIATAPIYGSDGALIGTVYSGYRLDNSKFVDALKPVTDSEVTMFLGDTRLSTTVIKDDGTRAVGTKADEAVSEQVLSGKPFEGVVSIFDRDAVARYSPIRSADGAVVGMLFVGKYTQEKTDTLRSFVIFGLISTLIVLLAVVVIAIALARRIVSPINSVVRAAGKMAKGDVDVSIDVRAKDETRLLADAFNDMIENTRLQTGAIESMARGDLTLDIAVRGDRDVMNRAFKTMLELNNEVLGQIASSAVQVSDGSSQVAQSAQSLAHGSAEQAAAVEELFNSITEISEKTKQNARQAEKSFGLNVDILNSAKAGSVQMEQMTQAVREINEASQNISKVIGVIDNIAFQTNILALNAAVEAARAGQHGKGFAVVAEEVRSLASKSAEAAKNTSGLIASSMEKAALGVSIASSTAESLTAIVKGIDEGSAIAKEIAELSEGQAMAIEQVRAGIEQVSSIVQQNSATSEETAAASEQMSAQAEMLSSLVARFRLKGGDLDKGGRSALPPRY